MAFASRQDSVLRFWAAAAVIIVLASWYRYEFVVKPIEHQRASRIFHYKLMARELRGLRQYYPSIVSSPESPYHREQLQRFLAWTAWFDGRIQALEMAPGYRKDDEDRIYHEFRSANPDFLNWLEQLYKGY